MNKQELREILINNKVKLTFTKVNGEERIMDCTLLPEFLPEPKPLKEGEEKKVRKENDAVIAMWDLNKNAFRSCRLENVVSVEVI